MLKYVVPLLAAASLVACFQMKEATTLYPDGSGKLEFTFSMKKAMLAFSDDDPFEDFKDPDALGEDFEGIVAWSRPRETEEGDWKRIHLTGYFEDINAVRALHENPETGESELKLGFELTQDEEGNHVLFVDNEMYSDMRADLSGEDGSSEDDPMADGMREMMKQMLDGMELEFSFTLPADIVKAEGFLETQGRKASTKVTDEMMLSTGDDPEIAAQMAKLDSFERGKLVWKGSSVTDEELLAFKTELEAAKVEWKRIVAEARAAAEQEADEEE